MARAGTSTIVCLTPLSQANTTHSSVKMGPQSLHNCEQSPSPPALLPIFLHWLAQLGCPACYWIVHWPYGPKFYIERSIFHGGVWCLNQMLLWVGAFWVTRAYLLIFCTWLQFCSSFTIDHPNAKLVTGSCVSGLMECNMWLYPDACPSSQAFSLISCIQVLRFFS